MNTASRFIDLPPYQPIEPFEVLSQRIGLPIDSIIKLDANENPYGPSPRALHALANLRFPHIYPDAESRALRQALEKFTGVPKEFLFAGAGADELLDLLLRIILEPADGVIICPPTFGMYSFDTLINTGKVIEVPRKENFSLDIPAIQEVVTTYSPKVLFVTNPNNPDGSLTPDKDILSLLELPVLVVVDEAYIEFSDEEGKLGKNISLITQVNQRNNLVVLRTFSKWAGLAGLRVGYGAFPEWLLETLWKIKQPYNVNVAASEAAIASLEDLTILSQNVEKIINERQILYERLQKIEYLSPYPSHANFILCQVHNHSAAELKSFLENKGIFVRYYNTRQLQNFLRISIGNAAQHDVLIDALNSYGQPVIDERLQGIDHNRQSTGLDDSGLFFRHTSIAVKSARISQVTRTTKETNIRLNLNLDGRGQHQIQTGLPFFDHMLTQIAVHGLFDIVLDAQGDLEIDAHHTIEDVALVLGQGFREALGKRTGIIRMACAYCPMDESMARVVVDFSGRSYAVIKIDWVSDNIAGIPSSLFNHFIESFSSEARCNLHAQVFYGSDGHHQCEALFKAFGRTLDMATRYDERRLGVTPSSKGILF